MNTNKVLFRGVKVGFILMLVLLIVYGTMKAGFAAFDFGYRFAIESLVEGADNTESTGSTEDTESTESKED